jgi:hypothetical protein
MPWAEPVAPPVAEQAVEGAPHVPLPVSAEDERHDYGGEAQVAILALGGGIHLPDLFGLARAAARAALVPGQATCDRRIRNAPLAVRGRWCCSCSRGRRR